MLALVLATILTASAWAEEVETSVVETPATAIEVTVAEEEFKNQNCSVYILVPYDELDTVLTNPAKRVQVKIAVALIAYTIKVTDTVL